MFVAVVGMVRVRREFRLSAVVAWRVVVAVAVGAVVVVVVVLADVAVDDVDVLVLVASGLDVVPPLLVRVAYYHVEALHHVFYCHCVLVVFVRRLCSSRCCCRLVGSCCFVGVGRSCVRCCVGGVGRPCCWGLPRRRRRKRSCRSCRSHALSQRWPDNCRRVVASAPGVAQDVVEVAQDAPQKGLPVAVVLDMSSYVVQLVCHVSDCAWQVNVDYLYS